MSFDQLQKDLHTLFSSIGNCYVKVKLNKWRRLPTGFVQFEVSDSILIMFDLWVPLLTKYI